MKGVAVHWLESSLVSTLNLGFYLPIKKPISSFVVSLFSLLWMASPFSDYFLSAKAIHLIYIDQIYDCHLTIYFVCFRNMNILKRQVRPVTLVAVRNTLFLSVPFNMFEIADYICFA